ncbi:MAG: diguanylate cyclase [Actinomycetota bacterium]
MARNHGEARDGGRRPPEWWDLAHRIRRLGLVQLAALVGVGVLIVLVAFFSGRAVNRETADQVRAEAFHRDLAALRHDVAVQESAFFRNRASGGTGNPEGAAIAAARSLRRAGELAGGDPTGGDAAKAAAARDTRRSLDALVRQFDAMRRAAPLTPVDDRRAATQVGALFDVAGQSLDLWVGRDADLRAAAGGRQQRLVRRVEVVIVALLGGLVVASLVLWALVQHGQRRMVETLDEAARQMSDLAATDPLTSLVNHGEFHGRLAEEVKRARRHGRELSLILMDLDHFKDVNDTRGHQVGDDVLVEVARRLSSLARTGDVVGRVGGEEFGWLLPETSVLEAFQAAERARQSISATPYREVGRMTLSAGVADLSDAADADELYRLADSALYWAKSHGRDITFRYSSEVADAMGGGARAARTARAQTISSLRGLARAVDARSPWTRRHSDRVAEVARLLAEDVGWRSERCDDLREAALLHDLGRISTGEQPAGDTPHGVPDPRQVLLSSEMAQGVLSGEQAAWLRHRLERWDGGGPEGLAAEGIPDGARILAVAEAWEERTAAREPVARLAPAEAMAEIRGDAGAAFDPRVAAALDRLVATGLLPLDPDTGRAPTARRAAVRPDRRPW